MSDEPRFTLNEAQQELARRECEAHGHPFDAMYALGSSDPVAFVCSRCSRSWSVVDRALIGVLLGEWLADVDDALENDPGAHDAYVRIGARWEMGDYYARFKAAVEGRA